LLVGVQSLVRGRGTVNKPGSSSVTEPVATRRLSLARMVSMWFGAVPVSRARHRSLARRGLRHGHRQRRRRDRPGTRSDERRGRDRRHGVVHLSSGGRASDLLRGRVLIEIYNAQLIGTWRRLKACHNARCHEVFFDQSKNSSRTWFDTAACANALNLRAYRERRKAARFSDLSERDPG